MSFHTATKANSAAAVIQSISRVSGAVKRLKTKAEVQSHDETVEVYLCAIPLTDTSKALAALKKIPAKHDQDLHHLRRVVKNAYLPTWLREQETHQQPEAEIAYVLLTATSLISEDTLHSLLQIHAPSYSRLQRHNVPMHAPTTFAHAEAQSLNSWPVTFNPNSSYGPNPAILSAAEAEMDNAGTYIALARKVGSEALSLARGIAVGVVIVEASPEHAQGLAEPADGPNAKRRSSAREEKIVCVAGDARWTNTARKDHGHGTGPQNQTRCSDAGNPAHHAVMRALHLVAQRRLELKGETYEINTLPLTLLEEAFWDAPNTLRPDGYLALNLHVYVSHEPCLMCSMALVHSRVGRVVFAEEMERTGGLRAEVDAGPSAEPSVRKTEDGIADDGETETKPQGLLGYGLFWRNELNWRFLCWQWMDEDGSGGEKGAINGYVHV